MLTKPHRAKLSNVSMAQDFLRNTGKELRENVALATVIGVFILVGIAEIAFILENGMKNEVVIDFVKDFHQILILAAGGGLVFLGIRSKQ